MRIGQAAKVSGVGVETIRFYERKGLVQQPPQPRDGGYRAYCDGTVRRLRFIRSAQALGFSLSEISELLALETGEAAQCSDIRERARNKRSEVVLRIENLNRIKDALDELIDACPGAGPAKECSILEAINNGTLSLDREESGDDHGSGNAQG